MTSLLNGRSNKGTCPRHHRSYRGLPSRRPAVAVRGARPRKVAGAFNLIIPGEAIVDAPVRGGHGQVRTATHDGRLAGRTATVT